MVLLPAVHYSHFKNDKKAKKKYKKSSNEKMNKKIYERMK